jgi:hypothetical protein
MTDIADKVGMTVLAGTLAFVTFGINTQSECPDGLWCEQAAMEPMHTHQDEPIPWVPRTRIDVRTSTTASISLGGIYRLLT